MSLPFSPAGGRASAFSDLSHPLRRLLYLRVDCRFPPRSSAVSLLDCHLTDTPTRRYAFLANPTLPADPFFRMAAAVPPNNNNSTYTFASQPRAVVAQRTKYRDPKCVPRVRGPSTLNLPLAWPPSSLSRSDPPPPFAAPLLRHQGLAQQRAICQHDVRPPHPPRQHRAPGHFLGTSNARGQAGVHTFFIPVCLLTPRPLALTPRPPAHRTRRSPTRWSCSGSRRRSGGARRASARSWRPRSGPTRPRPSTAVRTWTCRRSCTWRS